MPEARGVARNDLRQFRGNITDQFQILLVRPKRQRLHRLPHVVPQVEIDGFQVELARLNFGEVKNLVDHSEQGVRGILDGVQIFALLLIQLRSECKFRHSDDAVHRRSDLMAHVGQEFALGQAGRLGGFSCPFQLGLESLALGDVAKTPDSANSFALDSLRLGMALEHSPVLELNHVVALRFRIRVQLPYPLQMLARILELCERVPEDRILVLSCENFLRNLPHLAELLIVSNYFALGIHHQNAVCCRFQRGSDDLGLRPHTPPQDGDPAQRSGDRRP